MPTITSERPPLAGAVLLLICAPLFAHDMWIEPATFAPQLGQIVSVKLRVGQDLLGDPLPRDPALINQFVVEDGEGRKPVVGRDGSDPAGFVRVATPGLMVIGYRSNPSSVELPPEKFNQYLKDEGLDAIAAIRAQPQRNRRESPRTVLPLREEPGAFRIASPRARRSPPRLYARTGGRTQSIFASRR